jgi:hypothetical protein
MYRKARSVFVPVLVQVAARRGEQTNPLRRLPKGVEMRTDLRAQAAAAAMKWLDDNPGLSNERAIARGFTNVGRMGYEVGYTAGHSAGFTEGARAFAEFARNAWPWAASVLSDILARFLAAHAGTGIATDGKGEEGEP